MAKTKCKTAGTGRLFSVKNIFIGFAVVAIVSTLLVLLSLSSSHADDVFGHHRYERNGMRGGLGKISSVIVGRRNNQFSNEFDAVMDNNSIDGSAKTNNSPQHSSSNSSSSVKSDAATVAESDKSLATPQQQLQQQPPRQPTASKAGYNATEFSAAVSPSAKVVEDDYDKNRKCLTVSGLNGLQVVDSNGEICTHEDIIVDSGCCPSTTGPGLGTPRNFGQHHNESSDQGSGGGSNSDGSGDVRARDNSVIVPVNSRYACSGCDPATGCCHSLEVCIACCLHPESLAATASYFTATVNGSSSSSSGSSSRGMTDAAVTAATGRHSPQQMQLFVYQELWAAGKHFDYCSYRCRTSSGSVQCENSYRSELRHCYSVYSAPVTLTTVNSDRGTTRAVDDGCCGGGAAYMQQQQHQQQKQQKDAAFVKPQLLVSAILMKQVPRAISFTTAATTGYGTAATSVHR